MRTFDKWLLSVFFAYNIFLILRLFFNHEGYSVESYLFHPYMLPAILCFVLLFVNKPFDIQYLLRYSEKVILFSIPILFISVITAIELVMAMTPLFIIYESNNYCNILTHKKIISVYIIGCLYYNVFVLDNRFMLLFLLVFGLCLFVLKFFTCLKKTLWWSYVLFTVSFLFILFIWQISLLNPGTFLNITEDSDIYNDTRTFLYHEMEETLSSNHAEWWGLGLNGKVQTVLSQDIDSSIDKHGKRQFIEANILELLRRGGFVYLILYSVIILISSYRLLITNNRLQNTIGFYIVCAFLTSTIGMTHALKIETVVLMLFVSLGYSSYSYISRI